jgi:hypothetical protein
MILYSPLLLGNINKIKYMCISIRAVLIFSSDLPARGEHDGGGGDVTHVRSGIGQGPTVAEP